MADEALIQVAPVTQTPQLLEYNRGYVLTLQRRGEVVFQCNCPKVNDFKEWQHFISSIRNCLLIIGDDRDAPLEVKKP